MHWCILILKSLNKFFCCLSYLLSLVFFVWHKIWFNFFLFYLLKTLRFVIFAPQVKLNQFYFNLRKSECCKNTFRSFSNEYLLCFIVVRLCIWKQHQSCCYWTSGPISRHSVRLKCHLAPVTLCMSDGAESWSLQSWHQMPGSRGQSVYINQTQLICFTAFSGLLAPAYMSSRLASSGHQGPPSGPGAGGKSWRALWTQERGGDWRQRGRRNVFPPSPYCLSTLLIYVAQMYAFTLGVHKYLNGFKIKDLAFLEGLHITRCPSRQSFRLNLCSWWSNLENLTWHHTAQSLSWAEFVFGITHCPPVSPWPRVFFRSRWYAARRLSG